MINRVGYTDNRTTFSAYFRVNNNLSNLYQEAKGRYSTEEIIAKTDGLTRDLSSKTPNHELEIITYEYEKPVFDGREDHFYVTIRNNSTNSEVRLETRTDKSNLLSIILQKLIKMAEKNDDFWFKNDKDTKMFRLLTGQNLN